MYRKMYVFIKERLFQEGLFHKLRQGGVQPDSSYLQASTYNFNLK